MFFGDPMVIEARFSNTTEKVKYQNGKLVAPYSLLQSDMFGITPKRIKIVDVFIPENLFLKRIIDAPASTRKNLNALVELDMVRRTPFRPDTVYWTISKPNKSGNALRVEQWVIKKIDVEQLQKRLEHAGLRIRKVFIDGVTTQRAIADISANATPNARRWRLVNGTLAAGSIGLAALIGFYPAWQASIERARLDESVTQTRTRALALRQEVETLRSKEMERAAFLDMIYQRPHLSNVLRDVTVAMPDEVWISDLNFSPAHLIVTGEVSGSAAQLVLALAQHNEFSNPSLSGPIARSSNGAERFELTLDLAAAE